MACAATPSGASGRLRLSYNIHASQRYACADRFPKPERSAHPRKDAPQPVDGRPPNRRRMGDRARPRNFIFLPRPSQNLNSVPESGLIKGLWASEVLSANSRARSRDMIIRTCRSGGEKRFGRAFCPTSPCAARLNAGRPLAHLSSSMPPSLASPAQGDCSIPINIAQNLGPQKAFVVRGGGGPHPNRSARNGAGSTNGVSPVIISARSRPVIGPSVSPRC